MLAQLKASISARVPPDLPCPIGGSPYGTPRLLSHERGRPKRCRRGARLGRGSSVEFDGWRTLVPPAEAGVKSAPSHLRRDGFVVCVRAELLRAHLGDLAVAGDPILPCGRDAESTTGEAHPFDRLGERRITRRVGSDRVADRDHPGGKEEPPRQARPAVDEGGDGDDRAGRHAYALEHGAPVAT